MTHTNFTFPSRAAVACIAWYALSACSPLPPPHSAPVAPKTPPAPVAATAPTAATAPAGPVLHIDSASSLIAVTVRRGGILARLGHDHVVASHTVSGTVTPSQNRADLQFRLDQLIVDEADLRQIAGLDKQPSADAIDGTRHNMLSKVLDAERYPLVQMHVERISNAQALQVSITLHGVTRTLAIPASIREENGSINVKGNVNLKQTDFGITPFSVMAGAMAVQDQMELRFDLTAR